MAYKRLYQPSKSSPHIAEKQVVLYNADSKVVAELITRKGITKRIRTWKDEEDDVLLFMENIVSSHLKAYQSDFDLDKEVILSEGNKQLYLWMVRNAGTWLLHPSEIVRKDAYASHVWDYYLEQSEYFGIKTFLVEITGIENGGVFGKIRKVDYLKATEILHRCKIPG